MEVYKSLAKLIVDYIALLILLVIVVIIDFNPFVVERGFFINDPTIQHPLKTETVKWKILLSLAALVPPIFIIISDIITTKVVSETGYIKISGKSSIPRFVYRLLIDIHVHWFVLLITFFLTDFIKFRVGRLRPHFLTVCDPDPTKLIELNSSFVDNATICRGLAIQILTGRQSFPSGHSSMSTAACTSLAILLHHRVYHQSPQCSANRWRAPLHVLTLGMTCFIAFVGSSRVRDCWHHSTDVLSGCTLGFIVCLVFYYTQTDYLTSSALALTPHNPDESRMSLTDIQ